MALPAGNTAFKATITAKLIELKNNQDSDKEDTIEEFVETLADAIQAYIESATVVVPGTGLTAPGGGGAVTGTSITGNLE